MKLTSIGLQGLGLLARKGLLALSLLIVARVLGPDKYGELSYIFTWSYIFFALSGLGFSAVTTREVAGAFPEAKRLLKASLFVRVIAAFAGMGLFSALILNSSFFRGGILASEALTYAWIIPAYAMVDQLGAYVMAFEKHFDFAIINLMQWGAFLAATIIAVIRSAGLDGIVRWQAASLWVGLALVCIYLHKPLLASLSEKRDYSLAWFLLKEALPLAVTNLVVILYFRVGTLYLFRYSGAEQTGMFTSASQIVEASQLIPMAIVGAFFPSICRVAGDGKKLAAAFEKVTSSLLFIALFLATTGTVVSLTVVRIVFGASFASGGALLRVLIWTVVPTYLHYALAYFLIAIREQKIIPLSALIGLAVSLGCNSLLVPRFGALGAVYSSAATETCICVVHLFFVLRSIAIGRDMRFIVMAVAGAVAVWLLGTNWEQQINSTLWSVFGFCGLSLALFLMSFLLYRHLGTKVEVA